VEAGVKESFGLEARPVRDCWPTSVFDPIGAFSLAPDFWILLEARARSSRVDIQILLAAEAGTVRYSRMARAFR
jgi:hypothetical protein